MGVTLPVLLSTPGLAAPCTAELHSLTWHLSQLLLLLLPAPADFIYSEYLTALRKSEFRQLVWQIAQDYAAAALLLRLPGYVPMPAFTAIEDVPLVVRHARKTPAQASRLVGPLGVEQRCCRTVLLGSQGWCQVILLAQWTVCWQVWGRVTHVRCRLEGQVCGASHV